jgi:hypothetical protein
MSLAAWRVIDRQTVRRLMRSTVRLERMLEDWIEEDPSLVFEGLVVVARQLILGAAGRLDLLAVDPAGRWAVIEIKAGTLYRETVAQVLDYVALLKTLPVDRLRDATNAYLEAHPSELARERLEQALTDDDSEPAERDVIALIVGTGRDPGVERLIKLVPNVSIRAVTFEVFDAGDGDQIMLRDTTELGEEPAAPKPSVEDRLSGVLARAGQHGHRELFERFMDAANRQGLAIRPYKKSLMFTPPTNRTRTLFVIWTRPGAAHLDLVSSAFEEFFPTLTAENVQEHLGPDGQRPLEADTAERFLSGLDELFAELPEETNEAAS